MRVERLRQWSIGFVLAGAVATAAAQEPSSQKLFETGNYGAVAERADSGSPEDRYLAALAHSKAGNSEAATGTMTRLRDEAGAAGFGHRFRNIRINRWFSAAW